MTKVFKKVYPHMYYWRKIRKMLEDKDLDTLKGILSGKEIMVCPRCGGHLTLVYLPPRYTGYRAVYDTYLECNKCNFRIRVSSYTVYGAVRDFDEDTIEISTWSEMGSRETRRFYHVLDQALLKKLKEREDLVEFLVVNDTVLVVIG